jgi:5S rRNA maturation endonuclease (ribonuclease M5)
MLGNRKESQNYKVGALSDSLKKKLENVLQLLERLAKDAAKGVPMIIEGQKDIVALRKLGVEGDFISAKSSGKSFVDVLREVESRGRYEFILLLDFDRRGTEWTKRIAQSLERRRIKPNMFFWKGLKSMVRRDVKDIEGLATYIETLKKKCGG